MRRNPIINALGCAATLDISALSQEGWDAVTAAWSGAVSVAGDPLPTAHVSAQVREWVPLPQALSTLSADVTLAAMEARRGELWMLHAAGVADEKGRVVVLVGPSGQGKTTAARALSAHFGYVSDETVAITAQGGVLPYRKPLSVIEEHGLVKAQRSPAELGLLPLPQGSLRVAAIVLLDRRENYGDDPPTVRLCELGECLPELVAQTSFIGDLPAALRTISAISSATGGVHRVSYGEAATLPAALAHLFRDPAMVTIPAPIHQGQPSKSGAGIYRGGFLDAIELGDPDRVALLQPEPDGGCTLRVVTGIAPALWRAADGSASEADLAAAAVAAYGTPEGVDIARAVHSARVELENQGVLVGEPSWRIRQDVAATGRGGRFVAMSLADLMNPLPMALEGTAATIWGFLASARTITAARLVEVIASATGLSAGEIAGDVHAFLIRLESALLIETIAP